VIRQWLIDEVIGTAGQLAEKNQNRLVVEAQENLGALNADSMRLKQILLNLLSNACKFTKEGEVALRVRKVADGRDWVELAVADTAMGIFSIVPPTSSAAEAWDVVGPFLCNEAQPPTPEMAVTPPSIRKSAPTT
jgi:signal transduction histidine kinase